MASLQGQFLEFWIRRLAVFRIEKYKLKDIRENSDKTLPFLKIHTKVSLDEIIVEGIPSEWLIPPDAPSDTAMLYMHGGAWKMGSSKTHRGLVSYIAYESGIRALSINYRLAPEHPFPEGLDDCLIVYRWLLANGYKSNKIILGGDSAGGNLALALLIDLKRLGEPLPAAVVALSPATDLAFTGKSVITHRHLDPIFSNMKANTIIQDYINDKDPCNPLISPLYGDLSGLPPILIHVGEHEILLDDSIRFSELALKSGVKANIVIWPGMFHVFQIFTPFLPEARQSIKQIAGFMKSVLAEQSA